MHYFHYDKYDPSNTVVDNTSKVLSTQCHDKSKK